MSGIKVVPEPDLRKALEIANTIRQVAGEEKIEYLLPGIAGNETHCVLARTFNCGLAVINKMTDRNDRHSGQWMVATQFHDEDSYSEVDLEEVVEYRQQVELLHEVKRALDELEIFTLPNSTPALILPPEVGIIAAQFDEKEGIPAGFVIFYGESDEEIDDWDYVDATDYERADRIARETYKRWVEENPA